MKTFKRLLERGVEAHTRDHSIWKWEARSSGQQGQCGLHEAHWERGLLRTSKAAEGLKSHGLRSQEEINDLSLIPTQLPSIQ